jgi:hypothetical protein
MMMMMMKAVGNSRIQIQDRVARWFVFKPKIQIWVNFVGSCNGRGWYILWTVGPFYGLLLYVFYGHFVKFAVIWYIFPILVFCKKKNLAPLIHTHASLPLHMCFNDVSRL